MRWLLPSTWIAAMQAASEAVGQRPGFTVFWVLWGLAGLAIEIWSIVDRRAGDTLSEHLWYLLRSGFTWFVCLGILVWLTIHLLTGGRV